ncbi:hypothetical protein [Micromonospora endophytica]|uniref:hypothetical protein n=1 Tax=Micromonospora endophytica TaxID=515350 RepID=UPI0015E8B9F1|nr:hypothetical protein [Micromonospora endophytica]BCJ59114.1 hypothetical protein Jiend_25360 [Micromonospora endophytica]
MTGIDEPSPRREPTAARRGPVWLSLGLAATALLACCCSALVGLAIAWSTGLFHPN